MDYSYIYGIMTRDLGSHRPHIDVYESGTLHRNQEHVLVSVLAHHWCCKPNIYGY